MKKVMLALAMVVAGCSASMVNSPGAVSGSAYAPVNEGKRPGLVAYLNNGAGFVIRARRENAYKQMHSACGGPYRIDAEGPQESGGVITSVGRGSAVYAPVQYWYIQFSCAGSLAAQ